MKGRRMTGDYSLGFIAVVVVGHVVVYRVFGMPIYSVCTEYSTSIQLETI